MSLKYWKPHYVGNIANTTQLTLITKEDNDEFKVDAIIFHDYNLVHLDSWNESTYHPHIEMSIDALKEIISLANKKGDCY